MDVSPTPAIVADSIPDMLHPTASTWARGIKLGPVEPTLKEWLVIRYRELLRVAIDIGDEHTRLTAIDRLTEMGVQP